MLGRLVLMRPEETIEGLLTRKKLEVYIPTFNEWAFEDFIMLQQNELQALGLTTNHAIRLVAGFRARVGKYSSAIDWRRRRDCRDSN